MEKQSVYDPLLGCLVSLTHFYNCPLSPDALRAGLPLENNRLTLKSFSRAAARAGFVVKIIKRNLKKISNLLLPAILLLKDNQACILHKIEDRLAILAFPELQAGQIEKPLSEIEKTYIGYLILVQPISKHAREPKAVDAEVPTTNWFWATIWRYKQNYFAVLIAAFLINLFAVASPLFIMNVYNRVVPTGANVTLWVLTIGILILFTFEIILRFLRSYVIDVIGKKSDIVTNAKTFQQILDMQLASKPKSVGTLINILKDFESVNEFLTSTTLVLLIDIPFVFIYLFFIFYVAGLLVIVPIIAIPLILLVVFLVEGPMQKSVQDSWKGSAIKQSVLVESLSWLEPIKSFSSAGKFQKKWEEVIAYNADISLKIRTLSALVLNLSYLIQQLASIAVVVMGVYEIERKVLSLGALIAAVILTARSLVPISQIANLLPRFHRARIALKKTDDMMKGPVERPLGKHFLQKPRIRGEIHFDKISFQYPDQQSYALNNFSLYIKPKERLAIVGQMGSGKSSLQKLLLGLYTPQEGAIYLDGININQIDPADLRNAIGYVPQEVILFRGSIRENITLQAPWVSDEQVILAAKIAGIDHYISHQPSGYDTLLGERGENLSGGQRQAISIARAIVANPSILLFDEPTSAMDENSELTIIKNLSHFLASKTLILVTHRLPLLNLVDRLVIMDAGKVILDGPKEKVISTLKERQKKVREKRAGS